MPDLRAADAPGGAGQSTTGPGATGAGIDLVAEIERVRHNLVALAAVVEELRARHNAHTHGGAVAAPPAGERAQTAFTLL